MLKSISRIYIVAANEPFPVGMACTNRILSLSRGFAEHDLDVMVICLYPTEHDAGVAVNKNTRGTVGKIRYEYSCGTTIRGKNIFERRWLKVKSLFRVYQILRGSKTCSGGKILMVYVDSPLHLILFYILSRIYRLKFIQDKSEFPFVLKNTSINGKIYAWIYTCFMYRLFDAMLVMTNPLEKYFRKRINRKTRLFRAPMTVEVSRFMNPSLPKPNQSRYIAYCGDVGGNKDGVSDLLKSFSIVHQTWPDLMLYIIGDAPGTRSLEDLKTLSLKLGISHNVVFTGRLQRDEVPKYLCNAAILALARPSGMQAEGGFPSKLGEYLSTSNPVVVTRVGDIPDYLTDGENAFLVEPDDVNAFAQKIEYVLMHQDVAKEVGRRGKDVAVNNFDYKIQTQRIIEFLLGL